MSQQGPSGYSSRPTSGGSQSSQPPPHHALAGPSLPSSRGSDTTFRPSSQATEASYDSQPFDEEEEIPRNDIIYLKAGSSWKFAQDVLNKCKVLKWDGWCRIVDMKPTKAGGYIQVSFDGANKFAVLHEVVAFAGGYHIGRGQHGSHLCNNPACSTPGHVVPESPQDNNRRKNCVVWIPCPHELECGKKILICTHRPTCSKFAYGYTDMDDMLRKGAYCNATAPPSPGHGYI